MEGSKNNTLILAGSILLAGLLIAFGIYAVNKDTGTVTPPDDTIDTTTTLDIRPITEADHIVGSINASLIIVEYSDTECPYCKDFHNVMNNVMESYKNGNEVAWVYRHFPLTSIHPKASLEAQATECANEQGGNNTFWTYINNLYAVTPSNNNLDLSVLDNLAKDMKLDTKAFEACRSSKRFEKAVQNSYNEAIKVGATGTPFNVFVLKEAMPANTLVKVQEMQKQFRPGQVTISNDGKRVSLGGGLSEQGVTSFITLLLEIAPVSAE